MLSNKSNGEKFLVLLHLLRKIEITKYFNYKSRFNGVYSKDKLPRTKNGVYLINLSYKKSKVTHWLSLFIEINTAVCFDSFGIEYIPQQVLQKIKVKSITHIYLEYNLMILLCADFIVLLS